MSSQRKNDDNDDGLSDEDDEDFSEEEERPKKRKKVEGSKNRSFIDDAAEESGEEGDDDEDEDDDEDNNDYIKDGFVVDEEEVKKEKRGDLEDSDDEDDDADSDDDDDRKKTSEAATRKRLKKVKKRSMDRLDEDDLDLIQEAQQGDRRTERADHGVVARTEDELRRGLFADDDDEIQPQRRPERVERYDEYDDGFIEDDIGDQGAIMASERGGGLFDDETREVSEAQLNEASEIFGTDYLEFMADDKADEEEEDLMGSKYREQGVGVDYAMDSDEDFVSDEDDDLFGSDEEDGMDGSSSAQKAEALRLKREKRKLAKAERRRQALQKKAERRKAQLRRAFEPVQLVENFCTDRDDDIRKTDVPERFYDWKTPFYGSENDGMNEDEREQAEWIANRIPQIATEVTAAGGDEKKKEQIFQSIANSLRFMHRDKLEPTFIKHYRKDYITSPSVRENLHLIFDEDTEWDRMIGARSKVEALFSEITASAVTEESKGADVQKLQTLQIELDTARQSLNETSKQETQVKHELEALGAVEDDDDELFGDGDDDDDEVSRFWLDTALRPLFPSKIINMRDCCVYRKRRRKEPDSQNI